MVVNSPRRIVSLLSSATEILFALGVGEQVVGIGHECDWPPEATSRPRVTRSWIDSRLPSDEIDRAVHARLAAGEPLYEVDAERLLELSPDVIVTQAQCDVCAVRYEDVVSLVQRTPALAKTQIVALQPSTLAEIFDDIQRVGTAVGAERAAAAFVDSLQARIDRIAASTSSLPRPRVICIEWVDPLMLAANWTPALIELAGGESGLTVANQHSTYAGWQATVEYDPEVILIAPCGFDLPRAEQEARRLLDLPGWRSLAAVREGRVYLIDGNAYLNRSGPRIVDSLEIVAHLLHPSVCPNVWPNGWERFA
jgi:iron complex transport system substrate-binding protein